MLVTTLLEKYQEVFSSFDNELAIFCVELVTANTEVELKIKDMVNTEQKIFNIFFS
ncbi:hypothetical protein NNC19_16330 [Clostridium sp. SHJSY1]|uniref:hypothetical protein n=1 Tax=Clostridium sp. SHJSY1 TaxID=2942483 RepID=UPI00287529A8|nr:hypothetical protein [Clostridium sp. SHJSY1]MDS0527259.1 hypothetical protein [Clostridium sp. SHJSY1]